MCVCVYQTVYTHMPEFVCFVTILVLSALLLATTLLLCHKRWSPPVSLFGVRRVRTVNTSSLLPQHAALTFLAERNSRASLPRVPATQPSFPGVPQSKC